MNRMQRAINRINLLPPALRVPVRSYLIGRAVPFAATASCRIEELTPHRCVIRMANKRKVQNHIKSVHAAAMALLTESATGMLTGMSVPDDRLLVLKSMELVYVKRATGDMTAVANLDEEHLEYIRHNEKGEMTVPVKITDALDNETATSTMVWAWTPKKRQ